MDNGKEANPRELVCIQCPIGCMMKVSRQADGTLLVAGNTCNRGEAYARKELTNPTRIVTSTIRVRNGRHPVVSVKTREDIPKDKITQCMEELSKMVVEAPVRIGDVIAENVAGTGIPVVATKNVD